MNWTAYSKVDAGVAMMDEALGLLHIIDTELGTEDINESPQARESRILLHKAACQLGVKLIAELCAAPGRAVQASCYAKVA